MPAKILVTYASRAGSTQGVAEAIGQTLQNQGYTVDTRPMETVKDISAYDAVVAGSAIRYDRWLPEASQFVERHQDALNQKPFAAFLVCLAMATQSEKRRDSAIATASGYLKPVRALVPPISEGLFAGVLDLSKLPVHYRLGFRVFSLISGIKQGDYRDWDAIQQWAQELSPQLVVADV